MYRRPKFLEVLLEIRREMAHEVDYDVDLFVEVARAEASLKGNEDLSGSDTIADSVNTGQVSERDS
jgi:hypothetical protein